MTIPFNINDQEVDLEQRAAALINYMKEVGIGSILYYVHGSGDSPDDHSIYFYENTETARECLDGSGAVVDALSKKAAEHGLDDTNLGEFFWETLSSACGDGWYNNEGGYGHVWICGGPRPQLGAQLHEYPEPEAQRTGIASVFGAPIDGTIDGGGA